MAAPAVDTAVQKFTLSGQGDDFAPASGALSGTVSAYSGPWYVERQTLDIQYARVPHEQNWNNLCTTTLSGASTTHGNIQSTFLVINYTATYDTTISYQNYNLSSVQQPQEFTLIAASGDANGVSYGTVTSSTMGPMGTIITSKPYIRRTPYLGSGTSSASSQPLVTRSSTGSTFAVVNTSGSAMDATNYMTNYNWWKQDGGRVVVGNGTTDESKPINSTALYTIPGAYDTSKEFLVSIKPIIDAIGSRITNENHYAWPIANTGISGGVVRDEGFAEYDINRHA